MHPSNGISTLLKCHGKHPANLDQKPVISHEFIRDLIGDMRTARVGNEGARVAPFDTTLVIPSGPHIPSYGIHAQGVRLISEAEAAAGGEDYSTNDACVLAIGSLPAEAGQNRTLPVYVGQNDTWALVHRMAPWNGHVCGAFPVFDAINLWTRLAVESSGSHLRRPWEGVFFGSEEMAMKPSNHQLFIGKMFFFSGAPDPPIVLN